MSLDVVKLNDEQRKFLHDIKDIYEGGIYEGRKSAHGHWGTFDISIAHDIVTRVLSEERYNIIEDKPFLNHIWFRYIKGKRLTEY